MSLISPDCIKVIAETCGIAKIQDEIAECIIQDVEYKLRLVIQESRKYMKHSKRDVLSTDNVNYALRALNFDEIFGHSGCKPAPRWIGVPGYPNDVYALEDKVVDLGPALAAEKLPLCPRDCTIDLHWLAVQGAQPRIPENPVIDASKKRKLGEDAKPKAQLPRAQDKTKSADQTKPALAMPIAPPTAPKPEDTPQPSFSPKVPADQIQIIGERRHELSQDYQLYLDKLEETILAMSRYMTRQPFERMRTNIRPIYLDEKRERSVQQFCANEGIAWLAETAFPEMRSVANSSGSTHPVNKRVDQLEELLGAALNSLQSDPLRVLLPYLVKFIGECYPHSVDFSCVMLTTLTASVAALFLNPFLNVQPFIHQIIPLVATCVLRPKLGSAARMENHWMLRDFASRLLVAIVLKFGDADNQIQNRLVKTFVSSLQASSAFTSSYGALRTLSLMGHHYTQIVIVSSVVSLHSRAINALALRSNLCKLIPFLEIEHFLQILIDIVGNYFREMTHHVRLHRAVSYPAHSPGTIGIAAARVIETARAKTDPTATVSANFDARIRNLMNLDEDAGVQSRGGKAANAKKSSSATTTKVVTPTIKSTARRGRKPAQKGRDADGDNGQGSDSTDAINNGAAPRSAAPEFPPIFAKSNFLQQKRPKKLPPIAESHNQYVVARDVFGVSLVPFFPEIVSYGPGMFI